MDDDDDESARRAEMTYADLPSVPGGSVLDCSRAYTVDIPREIVANALPNRGVLQYVRLPAEEYNVLDSSAVERIDVGTFKVNAGTQKILMWEIEPVGTLRIVPTDDGCEQILLGAVMNDVKARRTGKESVVIRAMNASLKDLTMRNAVTAVDGADGRDGAAIRCQIDVAGTFTEGPFAAAGSQRLSSMLDWCLRFVLPWFLEQLAADYADWASGKARGKRKVNVTQVAGRYCGGKGSCLRAWRSRRWSGGEDGCPNSCEEGASGEPVAGAAKLDLTTRQSSHHCRKPIQSSSSLGG